MEPPPGNKVDEAKCGTSCPATTFTPPSDQEGVDICGTTLHTMVSRDAMLKVSWFMYYVDLLHILYQLCLLRLHHWWRTRDWEDMCFSFHRGWRVGWHSSLKYLSSLLQDGTPGLKGQQWTKVDAREETWHIFAVPEGLFILASTTTLTLSLSMALVISCFRVDTLKRWCATEVDSDGAMVPVSFLNINQLSP